MARPKKQDTRKPVAVRLNEDERGLILENAKNAGYGDNLSAYMRQCALGSKTIQVVYKDKEIMESLYKMDTELIHIEDKCNDRRLDNIRQEMINICVLLKP